MKNSVILIFFSLIFSLNLSAQDQKPEELLKKVIEKMESYKNFKAELSYTMVNTEMNINEKKTGTLYVEGDKYRIEMEGQIIISDGKTIWTILNDSEEVMISSAEDNDDAVSPTKILSTYKDYDAKYSSSENFKNSSIKKICLRPKEGKKFEKLSVVVNYKNLSLENFSIYDKNGNVFTYYIINLQHDLDLPQNTFAFNPKDYPDYEIEDMR
jgi:outer membrane lipoprotein-sorting protein